MADRQVTLNIGTKSDISGIRQTQGGLKDLDSSAQKVNKSMKNMGGSSLSSLSKMGNVLSGIKSGFDMIKGSITSVANAAKALFEKGFETDRETARFQQFIKDADEARAHVRMLQEMGTTPQFSFEEFGSASQELMKMTDGALGFRDSLNMVGDAAFATSTPIDDVARLVGRLFGQLRDDNPVTRTTMSMRNLGLITPQVADELNKMQKEGKNFSEMWGVVETELNKFNGSQQRVLETGDGVVGSISGEWDNVVRAFAETISNEFQPVLKELLADLHMLNNDGSIEAWASKSASALSGLLETVKFLSFSLSGLTKIIGTVPAFVAGTIDGLTDGEGVIGGLKRGAGTVEHLFTEDLIGGKTWDEELAFHNQKESMKDEQKRKEAEEKAKSDAKRKEIMEKADRAKAERRRQKQIEENEKFEKQEAEKKRKNDQAEYLAQVEADAVGKDKYTAAEMKAKAKVKIAQDEYDRKYKDEDNYTDEDVRAAQIELSKAISELNETLKKNEEGKKQELIKAEKDKAKQKEEDERKSKEKEIKQLDERLEQINNNLETIKNINDQIRQNEERFGAQRRGWGDRWGDAQDNLNGDDRKRLRNEANDKRKKKARADRREELNEERMQRIAGVAKFNINALTDEQIAKGKAWQGDKNRKQKEEDLKREKKWAEDTKKAKEAQMQANIQKIRDDLADWLKKQEMN